MNNPEPEDIFRKRVLRALAEEDRHFALVAAGGYLARKHGRFRTGVPLEGAGLKPGSM
jgi:hypothetical protein